jgi:hypothetical protein
LKIAIILISVLVTGSLALAQAQDLEPMTQLRRGVDTWPLITHPSTPAERHVNDALNRLNENMVRSLKECDASYRDWAKLVHQPLTGKNSVRNDWERKIAITMSGPRFLSIVAIDGFVFCGGAYPDRDTLAMVFDLASGKPVNWMNLIGKSADASAYSDSNSDGNTVGALIVPALRVMTLAKADKECRDAFRNPQAYQLWPDAKSGTLIAEPFGLPHVVAACADDIALTPDQARNVGFDEALLSAIAQAHLHFVASAMNPAKYVKPLPAALAPVLSEVQAKSRLSVLLPTELPLPVAKAKYAAVETASEGKYAISLNYELDAGDSGFAASFQANAHADYEPRDLPSVDEVKLSRGLVGYFRPVGCGGSCAPANLWWEEDRILYQIQLKLSSTLPEGDQRRLIITAANSAILAGPR